MLSFSLHVIRIVDKNILFAFDVRKRQQSQLFGLT